MANQYIVSAKIDIGNGRENNEDLFQFQELDDNNLLCVMADGTGSKKDHPQPAGIVVFNILDFVRDVFEEAPEMFLQDPVFFLRLAMKNANTVLGGFKMGNEEYYSGYSASVTCCLLSEDNAIYIAHAGNTRAYMIRGGRMRQLTRDHTRAIELLENGDIDMEGYYQHPDRLKLTSGLGNLLNPEIQTIVGKIQDNDLIVMTTDGVHYAIRQDAMTAIILESQDGSAACDNIITGQHTTDYPDNASIAIIQKNRMV